MPKSFENLKISVERLTVEDRVEELCQNFGKYLGEFDRIDPFTGPSVYFHVRTLERLKAIGASKALDDVLFYEYLYATLASWGMHRMGPKGAKMVEFKGFMETLQSQKQEILELQELKLTMLEKRELDRATNKLWAILSHLRVSSTDTQLVAGSKVLHHILPNLVPPIDGEHTLRFVYGYKPTSESDERKFMKTFPLLGTLARTERSIISQWIGKPFHTNETKVIDNAIIGYVKAKMKKVE